MRRALAILLPLLTLPLYTQYAETDNNQVIRIEGTEMAQLLSVTEVLAMLPGVSIEKPPPPPEPDDQLLSLEAEDQKSLTACLLLSAACCLSRAT